MWLLLLPLATFLGVMLGRKVDKKPQLLLPPPAGSIAGVWVGAAPPVAPVAPPSPMAVLSAILARGEHPPMLVVQCAIAEAELSGRVDTAAAIARRYGVPYQGPPPVFVPQLNLDPKLLARVAPVASAAPAAPIAPPIVPMTIAAPVPVAAAEAPEAPLASMASMPGAPDGAAPPSGGAPVLLASPIDGVPDDAFTAFADRLQREAVDFDGPKHVGCYRLPKRRLAELGFDAATLVGSLDAQDEAFRLDVQDLYRRACATKLAADAIGKPITMPDAPGSVPMTLSGLLALASVAGLEGAESWLKSPADRQKFPNTTIAFIRCNGVF